MNENIFVKITTDNVLLFTFVKNIKLKTLPFTVSRVSVN